MTKEELKKALEDLREERLQNPAKQARYEEILRLVEKYSSL